MVYNCFIRMSCFLLTAFRAFIASFASVETLSQSLLESLYFPNKLLLAISVMCDNRKCSMSTVSSGAKYSTVDLSVSNSYTGRPCETC